MCYHREENIPGCVASQPTTVSRRPRHRGPNRVLAILMASQLTNNKV